MSGGYIAVLDSGVGGLNVLNKLCQAFPSERFLYFGDNGNAPYGNKSIDELWRITEKNLDYILKYNIKVLVLGCNTLSTCLYNVICEKIKIPTVGIFPPVEYALKKYKNVLLLATVRTAENFSTKQNSLSVVGLPCLARDIENNLLDLSKVNVKEHLEKKMIVKKSEYDAVILGCTHYSFVKNQIIDHLKPLAIFGGEDFVVKDVARFVSCGKSIEKHKRFDILFVGKNSKFNKIMSVKSGLKW